MARRKAVKKNAKHVLAGSLKSPVRTSNKPKHPLAESTSIVLKDLIDNHWATISSSPDLDEASREALDEGRDAFVAGIDRAFAYLAPSGLDISTYTQKEASARSTLAHLRKMAKEREESNWQMMQFFRQLKSGKKQ
ncbi:uncharacterized protein LOC115322090 [Ixodes scapularis]|uniref:uncharacterized protein LOC115322090 n=1 Tax=Ixodes scapularis TaxID=6945 RepID=UPI001C3825F3|nr:uncharacterized protein LOC115322090 [Ixodes scapularis]